MGEYFPQPDVEFNIWGSNFASEIPAVITALGLAATTDDAFIASRTAFGTALVNHINAQSDAANLKQLKDAARATVTNDLRVLVRQLRAHPSFTDAMAAQLGLPVYDDTQTETLVTEAMEVEVPVLVVDTSTPQRHSIDFRPAGGTSRAKPSWARGCRIDYAIVATGAGAPGVEAMQFLASDTSTPYSWDIPAEHVGKDIWYRGRWETPTGGLGAWSDPAKGTVTG